ncbi:MAG: hypothetical protein ACTSSN_10755 [Candidatus Heimdallarchaeaceae archaeon]
MLNIKISLVTSTGMLLASKPEVVDDTNQILATGLVTALISFSKEVHHRELQSISYHDRTVSFIRVHDFVLILETIDEESTLTEDTLKQLLEKFSICTGPLLEGADPSRITEGEASIILDRCLKDIQALDISISERPLKSAEIAHFTLVHSDEGLKIKNQVGSRKHIPKIASMLDALKANRKFQGNITGILTFIEKEKSLTYTIIDTDGEKSRVGILKFPQNLKQVLFRLYDLMNNQLTMLNDKKENFTMEEILHKIMETEDLGNRLSRINIEDLSPTFLDRTVSRNLDKAIYSALLGNPVYVIGDKPTVKLVIDSMSIFTQHLQTFVSLWSAEVDIITYSKCDLDARFCGMSLTVYKKLIEKKLISETDTCINLESSKVSGGKSSKHFKRLFDIIKKLSVVEVVTKIVNDLEKLVELTIDLTALALLDKEEAKTKLKNISSSTGYATSFFRKALELAVKRNSLLDYLL